MSKHHKPGRRPAFGQAGTGPDYVVDSSPTTDREPSTETEPTPEKESDSHEHVDGFGWHAHEHTHDGSPDHHPPQEHRPGLSYGIAV